MPDASYVILNMPRHGAGADLADGWLLIFMASDRSKHADVMPIKRGVVDIVQRRSVVRAPAEAKLPAGTAAHAVSSGVHRKLGKLSAAVVALGEVDQCQGQVIWQYQNSSRVLFVYYAGRWCA